MHANDFTNKHYVFCAASENYEIAETLPAAGRSQKCLNLIYKSMNL